MLMFFIVYFSVLFFLGILSLVSVRKHLLSTLLSLEFIVLSIFFFFFFFLNFLSFELYFTMFFLTFSVCEGALGLSILVSLIRTHGNDYFGSFSILQC
uniref:NADH-ubiquinone oxidoreductase chain 4L n=1 Tax=Thienemanniella tusimufegea TaxID=3072307 RepID=A0AA51QWD3_9DIPT|nr:NADH dehydrogenase subunit 4L [Thienemanniella tusimufegea]WML69365.1 NADH dehydrogenase subunit 4L [Thienemanniella tusimufegea]